MNNAEKRGFLIVFSGPSGVGKGSIVRRFLPERSDTVFSVSMTTRAPRRHEKDGVHYHFVAREDFENMIAQDEFLEYAQYNGQYYGTPRKTVEEALSAGKNILLEIEVQGATQLLDNPQLKRDLFSVFVTVSSKHMLEERLRGRRSESEEDLQRRLAIAEQEMTAAKRYDYIICNDGDIREAVDKLHQVVNARQQTKGTIH